MEEGSSGVRVWYCMKILPSRRNKNNVALLGRVGMGATPGSRAEGKLPHHNSQIQPERQEPEPEVILQPGKLQSDKALLL